MIGQEIFRFTPTPATAQTGNFPVWAVVVIVVGLFLGAWGCNCLNRVADARAAEMRAYPLGMRLLIPMTDVQRFTYRAGLVLLLVALGLFCFGLWLL